MGTTAKSKRTVRIATVAGWSALFVCLALLLQFLHNPLFPEPGRILSRLFELLGSGDFWLDLGRTVFRSVLAFCLALFAGIAWAALFARSELKTALAMPAILTLQAAPVLIWIVPLVLLAGSGHAGPVLATTLVVLPLMVLEFREAFAGLTTEHRDFWRVYVPARLVRARLRLRYEMQPHVRVVTGLGLLLAFKASLIAEWFGSQNGLGRLLQNAFIRVDMETFLATAGVFLVVVLGVYAVAERVLAPRTIAALSADRLSRLSGTGVPLRFENVHFAFGAKKILNGVNFTLAPGQIALLTGPSGCGKTTFARLAAGLLKADAGQIASATRPALVFQANILLPAFSILENAAFFLPETTWDRAAGALHATGIETPLESVQTLSGGMKRRLAVARALCLDPDLVILDEPFNGLDQGSTEALLALVRANFLDRGIGVLLITHQWATGRDNDLPVYRLENGNLTQIR